MSEKDVRRSNPGKDEEAEDVKDGDSQTESSGGPGDLVSVSSTKAVGGSMSVASTKAKGSGDKPEQALDEEQGGAVVSHPVPREPRKPGSHRSVLFVAVVTILVVAAIVGLALGLTFGLAAGRSDDDTSSEMDERLQEVTSFLIEEEISDQAAVETPGTPQNLAARFMAEDQAQVPDSKTDPNAFVFLQRYALATYYYALGGPTSWDFQLNFVSKKDTCLWFDNLLTESGQNLTFGVQCDDNGQVEQLFTPVTNMQGSLPPEVGLLTAVTFLALPKNPNVTGELPDELWQLSNMKILDMAGCNITGTISDLVGNLANLNYLSFSDNSLTSSIPSSLGDLSLEFLALGGNTLTGNISALETLTTLRFLHLEHNVLVQALDNTTLKDLTALEQLDLSNNGFFGDIPTHFFDYPALNVLDLSDNLFASELPEFPQNAALKYLFLHGSQLVGTIPPSIGNLQALDHLDLSENDLSGEMPTTMGSLTNMVYLFLALNNFDDGPIPEFLRELPNLRDLSLKGTNRNGAIPDWIATEMNNLILLDLHRNNLSGTVPTEFGNMTNLALLLLNDNNLEGTIPDELEHMSDLAMLLLDGNTLTGNTMGVCKARNLQIFTTDCGGDNPEVDCTCCTQCCQDGTECHDGDLLARFDPTWENGYERKSYAFSDEIIFGPARGP